MRYFRDAFLDSYLVTEQDAILASVGAYRLEAWGSSFSTVSKVIISPSLACH
jgi:hypothetical protein